MTRALLVIGSRTSEDKYGIESGQRVAEALRSRGWDVRVLHAANGQAVVRHLIGTPPDLVIPVGFGAPCEDGHIYAVARLLGIPCAGPTPGAGSLMQDKAALAGIVNAIFPPEAQVRSPRGCLLSHKRSIEEAKEAINQLDPPLLIKPNFSGSSEGISVVQTHAEALSAATAALKKEGKVLVQQLEHPVAHEISCTVIDRASGPQFLPIVELRRDDVLVMGPEEKFGDQGLDRHIIPARLPRELAARIEKVVLRLHAEVGCIGLTRTDMLVLPSNELVILEQNGIPGLLKSSIACDAALAAGISFDELCVLYAASAHIPRAEPDIWEEQAA